MNQKNAIIGVAGLIIAVVTGAANAAGGYSNVLVSPARFLVQMRCMVAGTLPGDARCGGLIPLREGEEPSYRLSNGERGAGRIDMINLPVVRNGKWRVVSPDVHVQAPDGAAVGGVSVEGVGKHYLSILGSWSPVAMSFFVSDECNRDPQGSDRFTGGWVLGPAQATNATQAAGVTHSNNFINHPGPDCPPRYHAAAFTWQHTAFTYTSGRRFDSLVSTHYSAADTDGSPGSAEQRERIYLAYGIGLARWEKWSRDDWSNVKTGRSALAEAQAVYSADHCNRPLDDVASGDGIVFGRVVEVDGAWAERIAVPGQAPHLWYMTKCEDYATLIPGQTNDLVTWALAANGVFWR